VVKVKEDIRAFGRVRPLRSLSNPPRKDVKPLRIRHTMLDLSANRLDGLAVNV
jgi:hypothetical protein